MGRNPHNDTVVQHLTLCVLEGVIKGSEATITQRPHYLDFDQYCSMSTRSYSTFASQRSDIYALFQAYMKRKASLRDYDAADRQVSPSLRPT